MHNLPLISSSYSIYAHSDQLIDEFNELQTRFFHTLPIYSNTLHTNKDYVASFFNYWVQLINSKEIRIAKVETLIVHDLTIKLNQFAANHMLVHEFNGRFRSNEALYVLAYFIASEFLTIIDDITPPDILSYYRTIKDTVPYYLLTNDDLDRQEVKVMFDFRRFVTGQLHDVAIRERFNVGVYDAVKKTRQFLARQMSY